MRSSAVPSASHLHQAQRRIHRPRRSQGWDHANLQGSTHNQNSREAFHLLRQRPAKGQPGYAVTPHAHVTKRSIASANSVQQSLHNFPEGFHPHGPRPLPEDLEKES